MKNKIVAVELNNKKVKQQVLNAGGKDTFPSPTGISTVLKMMQKRVRKQYQAGYTIKLLQSCDCAVSVT